MARKNNHIVDTLLAFGEVKDKNKIYVSLSTFLAVLGYNFFITRHSVSDATLNGRPFDLKRASTIYWWYTKRKFWYDVSKKKWGCSDYSYKEFLPMWKKFQREISNLKIS